MASDRLNRDTIQQFESLPDCIAAGTPLDVAFAVADAHPSNQLVIVRRQHGRQLSRLRGWPDAVNVKFPTQRFRAQLPAMSDGEVVEYEPLLLRAGRVVERFANKTLTAQSHSSTTKNDRPPAPSELPLHPLIPRYAYELEFLGALNVKLKKPPESFGPVSDGLHVTFYIESGEVRGPRINAKIKGEGGDWMLIRKDGVGVCDVRITYETDDGALVLSCYYGIFDLGPNGYARALKGEYDPVPPLVVAPKFETSHPNWLWLNRLQCIGVGRVTMDELFVRFDIYAVHAGQPLPSSGLPVVGATT